MKDLLQVKQVQKAKKPKFTRSDTPGKARIKADSWRKPKGLHNKVGDKKRGHKRMPNEGYRTPKALRGKDRLGRDLVIVHNTSDLNAIDSKTQVAIVSSSVGNKNRLNMYEIAAQKNITIFGVKDLKASAKAIVDAKEQEKKQRAQKANERKQKREKKTKIKTEKERVREKQKAEVAKKDATQKQEAKKELDKVLTQKE